VNWAKTVAVDSSRIEHNHTGRRDSMLRSMDPSTNNQPQMSAWGAP
jgi:hypothetical protein